MTHVNDGTAGINQQRAMQIIRDASTNGNLTYQSATSARTGVPTYAVEYRNPNTRNNNSIVFSDQGGGKIDVFHIGPGARQG